MTGDELLAATPAPIELSQPQDQSMPPVAIDRDTIGPMMPLGDDAAARAAAEHALARSEARYRALVEATSSFVWRRGPGAATDSATDDWWERTTGQSAADANGRDGWGWLDHLHPDDRETARLAWSRAFATRTMFDTEYRVRTTAGTYRHFVVRGVPVGDDPAAGEWIGTFTDVTERELAERAARAEAERERAATEEARRAADDANRVKSEFLAVMSHELRTPLNAIGGYVDLLELGVRGPVTPEQLADLGRIRAAQRTLLRHINDVLNFAKLEAGQIAFDLQSVPVAALLANVEPLVAPQMAARQLRYECAPCDPALRVLADPEKATQVLLNLVANAIKFTDPGGRVTISTHADHAGRVVISVHDTGVGIAAEQLSRIFEPFVQVDARLTRQREGTGLGLSISRDLVRGMDGELWAESVVGVGSVFHVSLPRAE